MPELAANRAPANTPAAGYAASAHRVPRASRTFCLEPQHTADRTQIPGKDGGCCKKVITCHCCFCPTAQAEHSSSYPAAQRRRIRQARGILAVWRCLLGRFTSCDPFAALLSATQTVVSRRHQPVRQHRECLLTLPANSAPNPDPIVMVIVRLPNALAMADDGRGLTSWTPSR
jgi:hypothetical protein